MDVGNGSGVLVGIDVGVAVAVGRKSVGEGLIANVGVAVTGAFEGRLQAGMARTKISMDNKRRDLMVSPLLGNPLNIVMLLATYH